MATQLSEVFDFHSNAITLPNLDALRRLATSESGFVFDPVKGESYTVSPCGLQVLCLLKEGRTYDEVLAQVTREYDVDSRQAERDISDFIIQLRKHYG